jgi:hypothetical protein
MNASGLIDNGVVTAGVAVRPQRFSSVLPATVIVVLPKSIKYFNIV